MGGGGRAGGRRQVEDGEKGKEEGWGGGARGGSAERGEGAGGVWIHSGSGSMEKLPAHLSLSAV